MDPDDSKRLHCSATAGAASGNLATLETLGWEPFFAQQASLEALSETPPVRVVAVHRSGLQIVGADIDEHIPPRADATVGDWLLLDRALPAASRVLSRKSLIKRRAPGTNRQLQLIAANIDTAFVVTSCNQDFNLARLERYVALAFEDIETLSAQCRFGNCQHEREPGCAVRDAIEHDRLDPARLLRWRKLLAEDSFNSASLAERRTRDRAFGKMVRRVMKETKSRRRP